jgi:hypothetical protein
MRYLENLSSQPTLPGQPWNWRPEKPAPDAVRANKSLRDKWINDPVTKWCCYSVWEGLNENARISRPKGDADGNPPHKLYGIAVDFDCKVTDEEISGGLSRLTPLLPNYIERSMSGKVHMVWLFAKPIVVAGWDLAEAFLAVVEEKLRLRGCLPNFDDAHYNNPAIYLTATEDWFEVHPEPISSALCSAWLMDASQKVNWKGLGYNVPLEAVHAELLKNPEFANSEWANIEFKIDAQGPSWFVPGSASPKSAVVKESGMFTFSQHAAKNFYSWGDLLGYSFVDQYRAMHVGNAVEGVYFDGRVFWRELTRGCWKAWSKDDTIHYLRVTRGLSARTNKGENSSELDLAYQHIQEHNNVDGAAPFVFKKNGLITVDGAPFLNIHTATVLPPSPDLTVWGPGGGFPWLSQFFGAPSTVSIEESLPRIFRGGVKPLDHFLSWLAHFYRTAYELKLQSGCNIFISGPVNIGKTFLNREIIGRLMNGCREAEQYLMGEDNFGSELFSVAHWVVDDNAVGVSDARRRRWSEAIKKMAANRTFVYHEKFRNRQQVQWEGRVLATLNADEGSSQLIPDLERSLLDKIHLYRTVDQPTVKFEKTDEMNEILNRELPFFARWLLSWQTPEHCVQRRPNGDIDYRFGGVAPWHDPALVQHANHSSSTSGFHEILASWAREHFRIENESRKGDPITCWTGTAFELRRAMASSDPTALEALRSTDVNRMSQLLLQLKTKGYPIEVEDRDGLRYWTIHDKR